MSEDNRQERLVRSPVFILSPMRSGSTLLRVLLNSHSMIRAPHEMHLRTLQVDFGEFYTELAIQRLDLTRTELEYLLWDRLLHRELARSGKQIIVDKTPGNVLAWRRLHACWPEARYVFLLRHPASVLASTLEVSRAQLQRMAEIMRDRDGEGAMASFTADGGGTLPADLDMSGMMTQIVLGHIQGLNEAMSTLSGLSVRYEELVRDPARVTQGVCSFLGVPWEPQMLDYGRYDHGPFEVFVGDFTEKIRSGRVREARPLPTGDAIPEPLREACLGWAYEV